MRGISGASPFISSASFQVPLKDGGTATAWSKEKLTRRETRGMLERRLVKREEEEEEKEEEQEEEVEGGLLRVVRVDVEVEEEEKEDDR
jgi:hypothetical protein